jgi:hypothetical protein
MFKFSRVIEKFRPHHVRGGEVRIGRDGEYAYFSLKQIAEKLGIPFKE